jgi:RNA 2',3'-cyclic 3'-phosphodiesterase
VARLFFALWPRPEAARALAALAEDLVRVCGGKPVPIEKMHITLAFLGEVRAEARPAAVSVASGLRGKAFDSALDRVGSFRGAGVAWAGMSEPPARLVTLQRKLTGALREAAFELEDREFTPHVTVARRIARPIPRASIPPIAWTAREMTLVRSETGTGRYVIEGSWELGN